MKTRALILVACIALAAAAVLAHGGEEHVIGTVAKVTQNSISVKTANGTVNVVVAPETKFIRAKATAKITDLGVGARVVIHAKEVTEGNLVADTVEFSNMKLPQPSQSAHVQPHAK